MQVRSAPIWRGAVQFSVLAAQLNMRVVVPHRHPLVLTFAHRPPHVHFKYGRVTVTFQVGPRLDVGGQAAAFARSHIPRLRPNEARVRTLHPQLLMK